MASKLGLGLVAICALAFALPAGAHHSHGAYAETFMDIQGVVKEVHLVVPHSWVYVEVQDAKGEPQMWALEATGRTGLQRIGVTSDYVKPGDAINVRRRIGEAWHEHEAHPYGLAHCRQPLGEAQCRGDVAARYFPVGLGIPRLDVEQNEIDFLEEIVVGVRP